MTSRVIIGAKGFKIKYIRKDKVMNERGTMKEPKKGSQRTYTSEQLDRIIKRVAIRTATVGLAAGIISGPIISGMAAGIKGIGTKAAIRNAAVMSETLEEQKQGLEGVVSVEDFDRLEELTNAIETYNKLKNKPNRSFNEEAAYLEAYNTIGNSRELVANYYESIIKNKIAEAFNIKDKNAIFLDNYKEYDGADIVEVTEIILPDGKELKKYSTLFSYDEIDEKLVEQIRNARGIYKNEFSGDKKISDRLVVAISRGIKEAQQFDSEYSASVNKKGKIVLRSKAQERDDR